MTQSLETNGVHINKIIGFPHQLNIILIFYFCFSSYFVEYFAQSGVLNLAIVYPLMNMNKIKIAWLIHG